MLPDKFYLPFDVTYAGVTRRMHRRCDDLRGDPAAWLRRLVAGFQVERDKWRREAALDDYWREGERLRLRLLWLVACAYLHISYDLPRVIADEWPRSPAPPDGFDEAEAEWLYFDLVGIFPDMLVEAGRDADVLGWLAPVARSAPRAALEVAGHWVLNLRSVAWIHARTLAANPAGRRSREDAILRAMVEALKDVSNTRPWTGLVGPPNPPPARRATAPAVIPDPVVIGGAAAAALLGAALTALLVAFRHRRGAERDDSLVLFVDQFGRRVYHYVRAAFENPDRFDQYLASVRGSLDPFG